MRTIEGGAPLGAVELVAGQAQGVHAEGPDVDGDVPGGGHGVGVEEDALRSRTSAAISATGSIVPTSELASLIETRTVVGGQGRGHGGRIDPAFPVHGDERRREAELLQALGRVEDGGMLDGREDEVGRPWPAWPGPGP